MNDPYTSLKPGDRGTLTLIDDTGTVFANWDNGSTLGLVYGEDSFRRIEDEAALSTPADKTPSPKKAKSRTRGDNAR